MPNNNVRFQEPLFHRQSLANGFLYGVLEFQEKIPLSIKLDNGYNIPITIKDKVLAKAQLKEIDLSTECFCGVYPKTLDGKLSVEISTIYYPHQFDRELVNKFRIRGKVLSVGTETVEMLITSTKHCSFLVSLLAQETARFRTNQFVEAHACRIFDKLVIYSYRILD